MIVVQWSDEEDQQPWTVPRELLPVTPKVQGNDVPTLITDFFDWLETAWQLPLFQSETARPALLLAQKDSVEPIGKKTWSCSLSNGNGNN